MNKYLLLVIAAISIQAKKPDIHAQFYNAIQDYLETPSSPNAQAVVDLYDLSLPDNIRRDLLRMANQFGIQLSALEKQGHKFETRHETWDTVEAYEKEKKPSLPEPTTTTPAPVAVTAPQKRNALKRRYNNDVRSLLNEYSKAFGSSKEAYRTQGNDLFTEINNSAVAKDLAPTLSRLDYKLKLHRHNEINPRR